MTRLSLALVAALIAGQAHQAAGQAIQWNRDGSTIAIFGFTNPDGPDDPVARGRKIRQALEILRPLVKRQDEIVIRGAADFGPAYVVRLPECHYRGETGPDGNRPLWITRVEIDGSTTKDKSQPGFIVGSFASFTNLDLVGDCWNVEEDGGLIGWENAEIDGDLSFTNCKIDARRADWAIYSWNNRRRKITLEDSTVLFCRIGIAAAASGSDGQEITVTRCQFFGDANGSHSYGSTSSRDDTLGGILAAIVNRGGKTTILDSTFSARGLVAEYQTRWGCPRIAAIATNQYSGTAGPTDFIVENCRATIDPGTATVWNDLDIRGAGRLTITNRLGSNPNGSLKQWTTTK